MAHKTKHSKLKKLNPKNIRTRTIAFVTLVITVLLCFAVGYLIVDNKNDRLAAAENHISNDKQETDAQDKDDNLPVIDKTKDICVCFGDSATGRPVDDRSYTPIIAEKTGMNVINAGFAGSGVSKYRGVYDQYDAFCLYRLVDAIVSGNWSAQEQAAERHNADSSPIRLATLKELNWNDVDYITIFAGRDDINGRAPIDNPDNPTDTSTYMGALRYSLEKLQSNYPNIKILLLTPEYTYLEDSLIYSDNNVIIDENDEEHVYTDWGDGMIEVARQYNVPYVDMYRTLGINAHNFEYFYPENDGSLPGDAAILRMGERIATALMTQF